MKKPKEKRALSKKIEAFLLERMDRLECTGVYSYQFHSLTGNSYFGTSPEFAIKKAMASEG